MCRKLQHPGCGEWTLSLGIAQLCSGAAVCTEEASDTLSRPNMTEASQHLMVCCGKYRATSKEVISDCWSVDEFKAFQYLSDQNIPRSGSTDLFACNPASNLLTLIIVTASPPNGKAKLALKMSEILLMLKNMKKIYGISVLEWRNNLIESLAQSASIF